MNKKIKNILGLLLILILLLNIGVGSYADSSSQTPVNLGTTSGFAVLAGTTITNTGSTTINGDVGLHPGTAFTGQASVTFNGEKQIANAVAATAKDDLVTAYNDAAGRAPCDAN